MIQLFSIFPCLLAASNVYVSLAYFFHKYIFLICETLSSKSIFVFKVEYSILYYILKIHLFANYFDKMNINLKKLL